MGRVLDTDRGRVDESGYGTKKEKPENMERKQEMRDGREVKSREAKHRLI